MRLRWSSLSCLVVAPRLPLLLQINGRLRQWVLAGFLDLIRPFLALQSTGPLPHPGGAPFASSLDLKVYIRPENILSYDLERAYLNLALCMG